LTVDSFATVRGRKAGDMSKVAKFYLEKIQSYDVSEV